MNQREQDIEAREKAATAGPWVYTRTSTYIEDGMRCGGEPVIRVVGGKNVVSGIGGEGAGGAWGEMFIENDADADFIAEARSDISYLLETVATLREELGR